MSRWPPTHNYGSGQNKFESQFHQCATAMGWASPNEAINEDSDGANTVNPSPATLIPGLQCQVPQCPSESYQMNQQANLVAQYNHLGYAQVPVPVGYTNTGQHAVNPGYANEMVTAGSRSSMFIPMGSPSSGSPAGMSTFNQPNQPLVSHSSHVSDSNGTLVMTSPAVDSTPQSIHDRRHVSEQ
ncbi:uncharacterized protein N7483_007623 [Penicillium malachiteum]|uniref:uncharacterized protein n=1 Tax=Penicillium malachiteum TaxID=1324776 RepID=UPI0025468BBD|nr:uncharacterized protein N7483_007623 [Penicillium malachiteum]KAJ5726266.1 hypothetical protein N7483_007623 [Penicillium malachiteum]